MSVLTLPAELNGTDTAHAVRLVKGYFDPDVLWPYFSGAHFQRLDGGGDREDVRNHITGSDIVAVKMLSVDIPNSAVKDLRERAAEINELLAGIRHDVDLKDAEDSDIGPDSAAWALYAALKKIDGIGWVTANKLLARKRPRLLPVYDTVVRKEFGKPKLFWASLRETLQQDDGALHQRLVDIRDQSGVGDDISPLRIFDVVCWRLGMGYTLALGA